MPRIDFLDRGLGQVLDDIALAHHCTVDEILSKSRRAHVCAARRELCWQLHEQKMLSSTAIGELIGRDYTSVIAAYTKWESEHP